MVCTIQKTSAYSVRRIMNLVCTSLVADVLQAYSEAES